MIWNLEWNQMATNFLPSQFLQAQNENEHTFQVVSFWDEEKDSLKFP